MVQQKIEEKIKELCESIVESELKDTLLVSRLSNLVIALSGVYDDLKKGQSLSSIVKGYQIELEDCESRTAFYLARNQHHQAQLEDEFTKGLRYIIGFLKSIETDNDDDLDIPLLLRS